jgi:DNA modification methylase
MQLLLGDCREQLKLLADNSVDAIITDPPYELNFMNRAWDNSGIAYDPVVWGECLRVLKPGGHVLAFGGSRTYHRLATAIENAGFEIRDQIQWIYASGMPKSMDVSTAIDKELGTAHLRKDAGPNPAHRPSSYTWNQGGGETPMRPERKTAPASELAKSWEGWGTAIKPAHEPIVLARKPLIGTVATNVLTWGTGAVNVGDTRVGTEWKPQTVESTVSGRWPANVILDEVVEDFFVATYLKKGENARFFFCPKASKKERDEGLEDFEGRYVAASNQAQAELARGNVNFNDEGLNNVQFRKNYHPTVKPVALMRYLVRLVTPPNGTVLDPFMGSGTTGCAVVLEDKQFIGIERDESYMPIAEKRIQYYLDKEK